MHSDSFTHKVFSQLIQIASQRNGAKEQQPLVIFRHLLKNAEKSYNDLGLVNHNAMVLSTVNNLQTNARVVLLKQVLNTGLVFFTNYNSVKSQEIKQNPLVSLLLYWEPLGVQVRVLGLAQKTSAEASDSYFNQRDYGSKIGAWASNQSAQLSYPTYLAEKVKEYENQFPTEVPRPPHWGGYIVLPYQIEFWYNQLHRLHLRQLFHLVDENGKEIKKLISQSNGGFAENEQQKFTEVIRLALGRDNSWLMSFVQP